MDDVQFARTDSSGNEPTGKNVRNYFVWKQFTIPLEMFFDVADMLDCTGINYDIIHRKFDLSLF